MWVYRATVLSASAPRVENGECIEVVRLPIERALQMITDGEIEDAKTIIGLMLPAPRIGLSAFAPDYPAVLQSNVLTCVILFRRGRPRLGANCLGIHPLFNHVQFYSHGCFVFHFSIVR